MGVKGLWSLLNPVGRPVQIESLEGKRLAIDSSIWLYQFQSTMRDKEGRVLVNAHVLGFLRRINKLLFHGIKPVFVFDGGAPALKRSTIAERKRRKVGAAFNHAKMAEKLLAAQMRREAVRVAQEAEAARAARVAANQYEGGGGETIPENAVYLDQLEGRSAPPAFSSTANAAASSSSVNLAEETPEQRRKRFKNYDRYYLPEAEMPTTSTEERPDARLATEEELKQFIDEMRPEDFDVESEEFRALPTEVQYEIIGDLRVKSRQQSHKRLTEMLRAAPTALDFSKAQIKHLSQRNALTQQLLTVTDMVSKAHLTIPVKIAAERNREYVLVKKNENEGGGWALGIREGTKEKPIVLEPETPERPGRRRPIKRESSDDDSDSDIEEVQEYRPPPDDDLRRHRRQEVLEAIARRYAPPPKKEEKVASFGKAREPGAAPLFDLADDFEFEVEEAPEPEVDVTANDEALALALQQEEIGSEEEIPDPALARALALSRIEKAKTPPAEVPETSDIDSDEFEEVEVTPSSGPTPEPILVESDDEIEVMGSAPAPRPEATPLNEASKLSNLVQESMQGNAALSAKPSSSRKPSDLIHSVARAAATKAQAPSKSSTLASASRTQAPAVALASQRSAARLASAARPVSSRATSPSPRAARVSAAQLVAASKPPEPQAESSPAASESEDDFEEVSLQPSKEPTPAPTFEAALELVTSASPNESLVQAPSPMPAQDSVPILEPRASPSSSPVRERSPTPARVPSPELVHGTPNRRAPSPSPMPSMPDSPTGANGRGAPSPSPPRGSALEEETQTPTAKTAEESEPPLVETLHDESEDEEAIEWSRSPSPVRRKIGVAAEEGDTSMQSIDSHHSHAPSEAGDNGEMAPVDMVDEEDDYARFLAQITGRDLTDVRTEIDEEIRVLNTQTKAAMRDSDEITHAMVVQIQSLLRHFGIPYITAPMEAEAQCAKLAELGLVDGIITDDSDVFLFGGTQCFKNIFNDNKFAECILATDVERELSLTRERLISLSYLLGSDYTIGLPGIGPVLALELLANFPGPDGLFKFKEWWTRVQRGQDLDVEADTKWKRNFKKRFSGSIFLLTDWPNPQVREAYLYPTTDESDEPFHWGFPRLQALRTFLHEELSWSISKVDDELTPIVQRIALRGKGGLAKQKTLLPFFDQTAGIGHYAPRRRQVNVSKRLLNVIKEFREAEAKARGQEPEGWGEMMKAVEPAPTGKRKASGSVAAVKDAEEDEPLEEVQPKKRQRAAPAKRGRGRGRGRGATKSARSSVASSRAVSQAASDAASDSDYVE